MISYQKQRRKTKVPDEIEQLEAYQYNKKYRSRSFQLTMPTSFEKIETSNGSNNNATKMVQLPILPLKKVLAKISGVPKQEYTPNLEEYNAFHKAKEKELREKYYPKTRRDTSSILRVKGTDEQLDEIVLDCWKYGEDQQRIDIWKKYKQNFDELTYNTIRVISNKRRL